MRRIVLLALLLATLTACAGQRGGAEGPAWERNDPARRVYGGGI